ncbi:MAG: hypothetical protein OHK93_000535 [Ramalina farinacea]|uniref:CENP-V/GFA domain-containing protein n=1 Tax=Ramalina farinacea TaxID=258253 RepID=A0AA43QF30_9LECA|nr:hypothetical protein [Ramalina farinacea]
MTDPTTTPAQPKTWYPVSCHCRRTAFKILIPPLDSQQIYSCNCSICAKNGYLNVFPSEIEWPQGNDDDSGSGGSGGKENLKSYAFGSKKYAHKFCGECGSSVMIEEIGKEGGKGFVAVNARMIKGVDLDKLDLVKFDGWNKLQPPYEG